MNLAAPLDRRLNLRGETHERSLRVDGRQVDEQSRAARRIDVSFDGNASDTATSVAGAVPLDRAESADDERTCRVGLSGYFDLPAVVPAIAGNRLRLAVELLGSVIDDGSTTGEVAFTPLLLDFRFDRGQRIVPYVEGGEGIAVTWLRGLQLGGVFQFTSQARGGVHVFLTPTLALTFGYRLRHISNAGLRSDNRGLNTQFFIVGFSSFPSRR